MDKRNLYSKGYINGYEDKANEKPPIAEPDLNCEFVSVGVCGLQFEATFLYTYPDNLTRWVFGIGKTKANAIYNALAEVQQINATID
jgi:hypothetical protein